MYMHRLACAATILAPLSACGPGENDPGPGGLTVSEAKALDEAAEMLEERKLPPEALDLSPQPEVSGAAHADAAPADQ